MVANTTQNSFEIRTGQICMITEQSTGHLMERREFIRSSAAGIATAAVVGVTSKPYPVRGARPSVAPKRPNILLIVSDDNGPHFSCYGDPNVTTPHLDGLAAEGVRLQRAFVTQSICSPARSSIFTGLYPHQNGQIGLATHNYAMFREFANLPSVLKSAGYRTGIIGKLHVNPESAFAFDYRWRDPEFVSYGSRDVAKIAEMAGSFMKDESKPFFLMVNHPDAHWPFLRQQKGVPPDPLDPKDIGDLPFGGVDTDRIRGYIANYYNCILRLDTGVGLLLDQVAASGHRDDTLVVYVGDHGPNFSRGKGTCYETGLQVPFLLRWPGVISEGLVLDELVSIIDILPTVLEAARLEPRQSLPGKSLFPLLRGDKVAWREYVFGEWHAGNPRIYFPQRSVRDDRFKLIVSLLDDRPNAPAVQASDPRWWVNGATAEEIARAPEVVRNGYETWMHPPGEELYDLESDPEEFDNLAGRPEFAAIQERLRQALRTWQQQTGDGLADPENLARLTSEHDQLVEAYYKGDTSPTTRDFEWKYDQYLSPEGRSGS